MPLRPFARRARERSVSQAFSQRQSRMADDTRRFSSDERLASRVGDLGRRFPHLGSGGVMAMGLSGMDPDDPETEAFAEFMTRRDLESSGGSFVQGQRVSPAAVKAEFTDVPVPMRSMGQAGITSNTQENQALWRQEDQARFEQDVAVRPDRVERDREGMWGNLVDFGSDALDVARAGTRAVATGAMSLGQAIQGGGMEVVAALTPQQERIQRSPETMAEIAAKRLWNGERVDLGSGWFPGGEIRQESETAFSEAYRSEQGTRLTTGRAIAGSFFDDGSRAYALTSGIADFSMALFLDPASKVGAGRARSLRARQRFANPADRLREALVQGTRKTSIRESAVDWMNSRSGSTFARKVAGIDSMTILKSSIKGLDNQTALLLAETKDPQEIVNILLPKLGNDVSYRPSGTGMRSREYLRRLESQKFFEPFRLLSDQHSGSVSFKDLEGSYDNLNRLYRTAKMRPDDIEQLNRQLASIPENNNNQFADFMFNSVGPAIDNQLRKAGTLGSRYRDRSRPMTNFFQSYNKERAYWVNRLGQSHEFPGSEHKLQVGGTEVTVPTPHLMVEQLQTVVPLPDAGELRRLTGASRRNRSMRYLMDQPGLRGISKPGGMAENAMGVWKKLALLRGAYTVRVLMDEALRISADGLQGYANNPAAMIMWRLSKKGHEEALGESAKLRAMRQGKRDLTNKLGERFGRGGVDIQDGSLEDAEEFSAMLSRGTSDPIYGFGTMFSGDYRAVNRDSPDFNNGWSLELSHLASDPIARRVAEGLSEGDYDDIRQGLRDDFWNGDLNFARRDLMTTPTKTQEYSTRAGADAYIDSVFQRVTDMTGGKTLDDGTVVSAADPEMLDWVRQGRIGDQRIGGGKRSPFNYRKVSDSLEAKRDKAPEFIRAPSTYRVGYADEARQQRARFVNTAFDLLMTNRTNNLSRSPVFKQSYWNRMEDLISFADRKTADQILRQAAKARLPRQQIARMRRQADGGGEAITEHLDLLAKRDALDSTKKLLYDVSKRSNFADSARLIAPFLEAWKEQITTWSRLGWRNPQILQRGQQAVTGARETGANEGRGFFYQNDFGDEVFGYPGVGILASKMLGLGDDAQIDMTANVAGLNMVAGNLFPGVGPLIQIPAGILLRNKPSPEWVQDIIFPYGQAGKNQGGDYSIGQVVGDALAPAWLKRLQDSMGNAESAGRYGNATGDMMRVLRASGDYGPEDDALLLEHATRDAKWLFMMRGFLQSFLPTGPRPVFQARDEANTFWDFNAIADQYRQWEQTEGRDRAVQMVADRFGFDNLRSIFEYKTQSTLETPVTEEAYNFFRTNPDLLKKYPYSSGYFSPDDPSGLFDSDAYQNQIALGRRQMLTPKQMQVQSHNRLGNIMLFSAKRDALEQFGSTGTDEARVFLQQARGQIKQLYPNWGHPDFVGEGPGTELIIEELRTSVNDRRLGAQPVSKSIREYLEIYDGAEAYAQSRLGSSFKTAKDAEPIRARLRAFGEQMARDDPDFRPVWENVFLRDMLDADLEAGQPRTRVEQR